MDASVRAIIHWQYHEICRQKHLLLENIQHMLGAKLCNYVSFYGLGCYGRLCEGGQLTTSHVFVYSKAMIVDDHVVLIGSLNINDISFLGTRDSNNYLSFKQRMLGLN